MHELYLKFRKGLIATVTLSLMAISAPAYAMPVVVDFSFGSGSTSVTGTILGLDDELAGTQHATSLVAFSPLFGPESPLEFIPPSGLNDFEFIAGTLTRINFSDTIGDFTFDMFRSNIFAPVVDVFDSSINTNHQLFGNLTTSPAPVSAVPIPPAGILFGSGLVVLAAMRRRAKKQATA